MTPSRLVVGASGTEFEPAFSKIIPDQWRLVRSPCRALKRPTGCTSLFLTSISTREWLRGLRPPLEPSSIYSSSNRWRVSRWSARSCQNCLTAPDLRIFPVETTHVLYFSSAFLVEKIFFLLKSCLSRPTKTMLLFVKHSYMLYKYLKIVLMFVYLPW